MVRFETTKDKARTFNLCPLVFDQRIGAGPETEMPAHCCICHFPTELGVTRGLGSQGVQKEMVEGKVSVGNVVADECTDVLFYKYTIGSLGQRQNRS